MFDLENDIEAWCQAVYKHHFCPQEQVAELKDHLYCEIEALLDEGLTEEEAFAEATDRLGSVVRLNQEAAKNQNSFLLSMAKTESKIERWADRYSPQQAARLNIFLSLFFGAAIVISTFLIELSPLEEHSQTVMYILIAVWFVPFSALSAASGKDDKSAGSS
jgi:hypothetical protein